MAASAQDAHEFPIYGARYRLIFPIFDADGDLATGAAASTPDSELSKDSATMADCSNEYSEIATGSGMYYLDLIYSETQCESLALICKTALAGAKTTPRVLYPKRMNVVRTGMAQAGAATTITLDSGASAQDDFYNGLWVNITVDTPTNARGQCRRITDYVGSTKVATVGTWGTNPSSASTFEILCLPEQSISQWVGTTLPDSHTAGYPISTIKDGTGTGELDTASGVVLAKDHAGANLATAAALTTVDDLIDTEVTAIYDRIGAPAGASIAADIAAIEAQTDDIGAAGAGLTAVPYNAAWDAEIQSEVTDALVAMFTSSAALVDAIWDEDVDAAHQTAGTAGKKLDDAGGAADPWATAIPGAYGAGTAGKIIGDNLNATVSSRATQTSVDTVDDFLDTEMAATLAAVDTEVAAIKAKTDNLPAAPAAVSDIPTAAVIADAVLDEDMTGHQTQGSLGQAIGDPVADTNTIFKAVVTDATGATVGADVVTVLGQTDDIGVAGAGLTAVPWNAAWDAEVQSEVDDALVVQRLDELVNADSDIDGAAPPAVGSVFHELMTKTAGSFTYDQTTDSLEANRDNVGTAGAGLTAADDAVIAVLGAPAGASMSADIAAIEAQTDDIGAAGAGLTAVPWNAAWDAEVQSEATDALVAYDPPTQAELVAEIDAVQADVATRASQASVDTVDDFLDTELAAVLAAVDTEVAAIKAVTDLLPNAGALTTIQADLDNIQTRLPTDLSGGKMRSQVEGMDTGTITAAALSADAAAKARALDGTKTADAGGTTTTIVDSALTQADDGHWKGQVVYITSGPSMHQTALITDFTAATDTLTFEPPLSSAIGAGITYEILPSGRAQVGALSAGTIADAVWDELKAGHTVADSFGDYLDDEITSRASQASLDVVDGIVDDILVDTGTTLQGELDGIQADTEDIQAKIGTPAGVSLSADVAAIEAQTDDIGVAGAGLTAVPWNAAWDAEVQSEVADALTAFDAATATGVASRASQASVDTIDDFLDTEVAAIKAKTDNLPTDPADQSLVIAATDAIYARLGAPAGASMSADIAAIEDFTDEIAGLKALVTLASGTADSGTTTTMVDAARTEADPDYWKDARILFTSGTIAGQCRLITGFDEATDTTTFSPATTQAVGTNTYEILPGTRSDVGLWAGTAPNALVAGRVDSSTGAMAAGVVTAAAIAAGAVDADALAADAVTEIQAGLATSAALATVQSDTDDIQSKLGTPAGASLAADIAAIEAQTDDIGVAGAGLTAVPWNAAWDAEVQSEVADALTVYGAAVPGDAMALTTAAVDNIWDEDLDPAHVTAGSAGKALIDAGAAGDPWATAIPGAYGAGTAGKIVGDNVNATISSRASQASVDTVDDFLDTELAAVLAAVDTEVAAIKAVTDLLPNAGALTDLAAIKAKTDNLPTDPADQSLVIAATDAIYSRLGAPAGASMSADIAAIEAQTDDIGVAGAGLTALGDVRLANLDATVSSRSTVTTAQVNTEVDTAIADVRLDELLAADSDIDGAAPPAVGSVFHELLTKTAGSFTYDQTTDSLEAIRDKETDIETDTAVIGALGAGLTAVPWNAAWDAEVQSEVADALVAYGAAATGDAMALTSGAVDAIWDEDLDPAHVTAGSAGKALIDSGAAADPWATAIPGAYGAGTAGKILGDNVNATISSRATQASVDAVDDFLDTEIAAIKAKTDTLPSDPADASDVIAATDAIYARLGAPAGASMSADIAAIEAQTDDIGTAGAGLTNVPWNAAWDAEVQSEAADALVAFGAATAAALDIVDNFLDTEIAAIKAKTDLIPAAPAAVGDVPTAAAVADAVWDEATAGHSAAGTYGEHHYLIYSGQCSGATTTTTLIDSGLSQADTDHWKGRIILFADGALKYQGAEITAFDPGTDKLTFTAVTQAPTAGPGGTRYIVV